MSEHEIHAPPLGSWLTIHGRECEITIEPRPSYCDRGNYLAKLHPFGQLAQDIDESDAWPRYYFDFAHAVAEVKAWLAKRDQLLL